MRTPWTVLNIERAEARRVRYQHPGDDPDGYDPDDDRPQHGFVADPYTGTCPACGGHVSPSLPGGSCLWRPPGPWHPACRAADKAAGGTRNTPPACAAAG